MATEFKAIDEVIGKKRVSAFRCAVIVCVVVLCVVGMRVITESNHIIYASERESVATAAIEPVYEPSTICVHVGGAVLQPGVYSLVDGSRVADAIALAGGLTEEARGDRINQARILSDGEQVIVPGMDDEPIIASYDGGGYQQTATDGRININTASLAELMRLKGIGESLGSRIIDYRESNGAFRTPSDITNVRGIGQKTYEAIADAICV